MAFGTYSVLLIYNSALMNTSIALSDIQRAVYSPDYTMVWTGGATMAEISKFVQDLKDQQFVIGDLKTITSPSTTQ